MLTPDQLDEIEAAKEAGHSIAAIASDLGIDRSTVRAVFNGRHPLQLGRKPPQQKFPVVRFLRAFADVYGPLGVELQSPDEQARYEQIRQMRDAAAMAAPAEANDDIA